MSNLELQEKFNLMTLSAPLKSRAAKREIASYLERFPYGDLKESLKIILDRAAIGSGLAILNNDHHSVPGLVMTPELAVASYQVVSSMFFVYLNGSILAGRHNTHLLALEEDDGRMVIVHPASGFNFHLPSFRYEISESAKHVVDRALFFRDLVGEAELLYDALNVGCATEESYLLMSEKFALIAKRNADRENAFERYFGVISGVADSIESF